VILPVILLIDNYDSFVHNLARYFSRLGQVVHVVRNDEASVADIESAQPDAIVLSPGPCTPREAGVSLELVRHLRGKIPMLGVCLGHQTIGAALGAEIVRAVEPMHGRTSLVEHGAERLFAGLPNPLVACRYHSLVVDPSTLPQGLAVTARTADGTVMAIEHLRDRLWGVQFHPEAVLTVGGYRLLANFLRLSGIEPSEPLPTIDDEIAQPRRSQPLPAGPVTF